MIIESCSQRTKQRHSALRHESLTLVEAVLADSELMAPCKLETRTLRGTGHGFARSARHGRFARTADVAVYRLRGSGWSCPKGGSWFQFSDPTYR